MTTDHTTPQQNEFQSQMEMTTDQIVSNQIDIIWVELFFFLLKWPQTQKSHKNDNHWSKDDIPKEIVIKYFN